MKKSMVYPLLFVRLINVALIRKKESTLLYIDTVSIYMPVDLISSKRLTMNKLVSKNLSTQFARQASSERSNLLLTLEIHLS